MLQSHRLKTVLLALLSSAISTVAVGQSNSCIPPMGLVQASSLENEAGLTWNSVGTASAWTVVWDASGTSPEHMMNSLTVYDTWALIPYNPNSGPMEAYVQTACGSSGSSWIGPVLLTSLNNCATPNPLSNQSKVLCGEQMTQFRTPNGADVLWWHNGEPVGYGNSFETDTLRSKETYWMIPSLENGEPQFVGPSLQNQTGSYANFSSGIAIEVFDTLILDSATFMADGAIDFEVQIWNSRGSQLLSSSAPLHFDYAGTQRFNLDIPLEPGRYQIKLDIKPGGARLFRSTGMQNYPYRLPGLMNLDSATNGLPNRYYYLYDLSVKYLCQGPASSIDVYVGQMGNAGDDSQDSLCIRDTLFNLSSVVTGTQISQASYWLDAKTNDTVAQLDLNHFTPGTILELIYIDPGTFGCADTSNHILFLQDCKIGIDENDLSGISVYPNPSMGQIQIDHPQQGEFELTLFELDGRQLETFTGSHLEPINISHLNPGVYIVLISDDSGSHAFRIQKI